MPAELTRARLEQISPSFCPLRWTYMQVDLEHGRVKACCKTPFQQVTTQELRESGRAAIFNASYFQDRRREMLRGAGHSDCNSCLEQERLGLLSYRLSEAGKEPHSTAVESIAAERPVGTAVPKHIEFILSTLCDLKCTYCGPDFSSSWAMDVRKNGAFPMLGDEPALAFAPAEFREIFWQWFDLNLPRFDYIQFNGGEPLIQREFYNTLQRIDDARVALQMGVISNLNTPAASLARFRKVLPELMSRHQFRLGVSQDSVGSRAEYIRYGLRWSNFDHNLRLLLREFSSLEVQIAPTMSALNVTSFRRLLEYLDQLSDEFGPRVLLRPSVVMFPEFLSPWALPIHYAAYLDDSISYLDRIGRWPEMKERLCELLSGWQRASQDASLESQFVDWIRYNDARAGVRFVDVFPEMSGLLEARAIADPLA